MHNMTVYAKLCKTNYGQFSINHNSYAWLFGTKQISRHGCSAERADFELSSAVFEIYPCKVHKVA